MNLTEVTIAPEEGKKGRAFSAICLCSTTADTLWKGGETDSKLDRPVHAVFAGSEDEMRSFAANLQLGREALESQGEGYHRRGDKSGYQFLKSAGYKYAWQREDEGSILTVYLPELFLRDPGMVDPEIVKFVCLPSKAWSAAQLDPSAKTPIDVPGIVKYAKKMQIVRALNAIPKDDRGWRDPSQKFVPKMPDERLASLVTTAYLFADYLDKRSRAPIPADGKFYLHLMLACLYEGLATFSTIGDSGYHYDHNEFGEHKSFKFGTLGVEDAGYLPGIAFQAKHDRVEGLLARCVEEYFSITKGK